MGIPDLTHLQFAVLSVLMDGELSGRELRTALAQLGQKHSLAAFYQIMGRMEDGSLVKGRYEQQMVAGVAIKERVYEVTGDGHAAFEASLQFYAERSANRLGWMGA